MIKISYIFNQIFHNQEINFLNGFSFFVVSLIGLHFIFYLNFYNFSSYWVSEESKKLTLEISPNEYEKKIPKRISEKIISIMNKQVVIDSMNILDEASLKNKLGIEDLNEFSSIRVPFFIEIKMAESPEDFNANIIKQDIENRKFQIHFHRDNLFEINDFIYKIKLFIFLMGIVILILFIFFLTLILKTSITSNYKFLESIEIMGAETRNISINVTLILFRKIFPGIILGVLFAILVSSLLINLFDIPLNYSVNILNFNNYLMTFFSLVFFISTILVLIFLYLFFRLTYFLEKKFFV